MENELKIPPMNFNKIDSRVKFLKEKLDNPILDRGLVIEYLAEMRGIWFILNEFF